jgi:branched-chain amino acid transport system permease protein
MDQVLSVFVIGISFGLILFLLAAGLSLTMGLMRIINMAHGALYMLGGYIGLDVALRTHNFWAGLVAGAVVTGLVGLILETAFLRRLYKQEASQVLLTIGFIYIFINAAQWIWGTYPLSGLIPGILKGAVNVGTVDIPYFRFAIIGFGLVMAVLLWLFQDKTKVGAIIRAGMDNREVVGTLGINLKIVFTGIFALGSLVAGLCGWIGAPITGINLGVGWDALLYALIVVVIGGAGSVQGGLLGGILLGLLDAFGKAYFPSAAYFIVYIALIIILLVRPAGLLGRKLHVETGPPMPERMLPKARRRLSLGDDTGLVAGVVPAWRKGLHRYTPVAFAAVVLALLPLGLASYQQGMMAKVLIMAIFAMSLDLTMGYVGLISFGHAAFLGIGGYAVGMLVLKAGITSFWLVVLIAIAITAVLAAIIGYISLRVTGIYFLLVTMTFGQLLFNVATKWYSMTGGSDGLMGIGKPELGFHVKWTNLNYYYLVFVVFILCFVILRFIVRSPFGSALVGIRENSPRMRSVGYNVWALKYVAVIVGGVFAGVAGILFAYFQGNMAPSYISLEVSALPMLMVIMGGPATLWGPCLGAAVIVVVEYYARIHLPERWPLILGGIFVVCVILLKGGFARYLNMLWSWVGRSWLVPKGARGSGRSDASEEVKA